MASCAPEPIVPSPAPSAVKVNVPFLTPHITENAFADEYSRTILLRGVNLSGDAKYPNKEYLAGTPEFYDVSQVSYVGKPFSGHNEAREWFERLRSWGVNVVRFVVCWEALEPRRMGEYDEDYVNYVAEMVERADRAGIAVFIDGHQDTWSRFTGGSGAPLWTFELVGLDASQFPATTAACLEPRSTSSWLSTPSSREWPTNYSKFAVATMFTLFFAGETFAPKAVYEGEEDEFRGQNLGYVLRTAYIRAYAYLMKCLRGYACVLGVDPMNEPHRGYIGLESLHNWNDKEELHLGYMPNAIQGMALASGVPAMIPKYERSWPGPSYISHQEFLNDCRLSAWLPGRKNIWVEEGVFQINPDGLDIVLGTLGPSYFHRHPKERRRKIDFERDYYMPFIQTFRECMTGVLQGGRASNWTFVEPIPNSHPPKWTDSSTAARCGRPESVCYSPHWYDIRTLYEKELWKTNWYFPFPIKYSVDVIALAAGSRNIFKHLYYGHEGMRCNYVANFRRFLKKRLPVFRPSQLPTPVLIGETGIPFDINDQASYATGNLHNQLIQMDSILHAMEKNLLNWTYWNVTLSHNTAGQREKAGLCANETLSDFQSGDGWNSEDFSIVSRDPATTELPLACHRPDSDEEVPRPNDNGVCIDRAGLFGETYRGGRLLPSFIRPYPVKTAGILERALFSPEMHRFEMEYWTQTGPFDNALERTTEIFIPAYHYGGRSVEIRFCIVDRGIVTGDQFKISKNELYGCSAGLQWEWNASDQSLKLIHGVKIQGTRVSMQIEAIPGEPCGWFS